MQIIFTSLQTGSHTNTPSLNAASVLHRISCLLISSLQKPCAPFHELEEPQFRHCVIVVRSGGGAVEDQLLLGTVERRPAGQVHPRSRLGALALRRQTALRHRSVPHTAHTHTHTHTHARTPAHTHTPV